MNTDKIDQRSSKIKATIHGFFISITTTIAEPAIILPLIINYFSSSSLLVGIFTSLLKGGAIFVQLVAAYFSQSSSHVMGNLRYVFLVRVLSWFFIGLSIYLFGNDNPTLTLWCIGIGLFTFSFAAGFGSIYFNEILAKSFTNAYRAKVFASRQIAAGVGALLSGFIAGIILEYFPAPLNFSLLFMLSSFMMVLGVVAFSLIKEVPKTNTSQRERKFSTFVKNALIILKSDEKLKNQIITYLLSYAHLFSLPFIILDAKESIELSGIEVGYLLSTQIIGAISGNILWGKIATKKEIRVLLFITISVLITSNLFALFATSFFMYGVVFFLLGSAIDGIRLAFSNSILNIAPEAKRPIYIALQANLSSFGMFFPIIGSFILSAFGYNSLYVFTIVILLLALFFAKKL